MTITIPISPETIALCTDHDAKARDALIDELITEEDSLAPVCEPYCLDARGTVMGCSISIVRENLTIEEDMTGSVWIEFIEEAYYGCSNMDKQDDREFKATFVINKEAETIEFTVIETPLREPDEL